MLNTSSPKLDSDGLSSSASIRTLLNAICLGLIVTGICAVLLLWLERRSGIDLEGDQFRTFLAIIFLVVVLTTYSVLEFIRKHLGNQRPEAAANRARSRRQGQSDDEWAVVGEPSFDPIFKTTEDSDQSNGDGKPEPSKPGEEYEAKPAPFETLTGTFSTETNQSPEIRITENGEAPSAMAEMGANADTLTQNTTVTDATLFARIVADALDETGETFSPFSKYGQHLFLAGACGELTQQYLLSADQGKNLLVSMLTLLGVGKQTAEAFATNANVFSQVPHFRGPIDAGYRAMAQFISDGTADATDLENVLAQWQPLEVICEVPEYVTFFATSVGVTSQDNVMTEEDRQRVVRMHNSTIWNALERYQGRELHDLGSGIVAVFPSAAAAVRAATMCQGYLDIFAKENPSLTVGLRVGIDTELAAKVNEEYISVGTTRAVSIAAYTDESTILCSEKTREDALESAEFEPFVVTDGHRDFPPLFTAQWSRLINSVGP